MKFSPSLLALLALLTICTASAQTPEQQPSGQTRPRTVTVIPPPSQQPVAPQTQPAPASTQSAPQPDTLTPPAAPSLITSVPTTRAIPPDRIRARITEAERLLRSRPQPTAMTTTFPSTDFVTLAALDQDSSQIHLLTVPKTVYL